MKKKDLSAIQKNFLEVIKKESKDNICRLTDYQIYNMMDVKPNAIQYISRLFTSLEGRKLLTRSSEYVQNEGIKRIITIHNEN